MTAARHDLGRPPRRWLGQRVLPGLIAIGVSLGCMYPATAARAEDRDPQAGRGTAASAARSMRLFGGAVTIAGPSGFCVDPEGSRDGETAAFVLLGGCAVPGDKRPVRNSALLTAGIVNGGTGLQPLAISFSDMAVFFQTEKGRAMLARSGHARDVRIRKVTTAGEVMYLRLEDRSALGGQAVAPGYWRAILSVNGRIVSLSVLGVGTPPLNEAESRRLLGEFVSRVQTANYRR